MAQQSLSDILEQCWKDICIDMQCCQSWLLWCMLVKIAKSFARSVQQVTLLGELVFTSAMSVMQNATWH